MRYSNHKVILEPKYHALKVCVGGGGVEDRHEDPRINLGTTWRRIVRFTLMRLWGENLRCSLDRRRMDPRASVNVVAKRKITTLSGIEQQVPTPHSVTLQPVSLQSNRYEIKKKQKIRNLSEMFAPVRCRNSNSHTLHTA
jgi:hypothetical protein